MLAACIIFKSMRASVDYFIGEFQMPSSILTPEPQMTERKVLATGVRSAAANLRSTFPVPEIKDNDELTDYWPYVPATFTKGFEHNNYGVLKKSDDLAAFIAFINQDDALKRGFPYPDPIGDRFKSVGGRIWESPLAGHAYDLEGPDAGELTIPPAPRLESGELAAEMAEVYALALLRDYPFSTIEKDGANPVPAQIKAEIDALKQDSKASTKKIQNKITDLERQLRLVECAPKNAAIVNKAMKQVKWFKPKDKDPRAEKRRRARAASGGIPTSKDLYRGSTVGAKKGPYISQFMLIGNNSRPSKATNADAYNIRPNMCDAEGNRRKVSDGFILYGTQEINQRFAPHKRGVDHMTKWDDWCAVQNGVNKPNDEFETTPRFITTPRDLATYVHFDQLYQAYLNACLLMLSFKHELDPGLPKTMSRDGFATFGGPHLLSLVTEVASRALKHARRQKFNTHLRARPEAIGGRLTLAANGKGSHLGTEGNNAVTATLRNLPNSLLSLVDAHNNCVNEGEDRTATWSAKGHKNYLLPMAFPEGSPMHPSYAAGHATVAGACVTILKAFFDMFSGHTSNVCKTWTCLKFSELHKDGIFEPSEDGLCLNRVKGLNEDQITILGELDKLAANISIGRDMAGVHYYTDYYESLRMGERVAVGILQEQMLTYRDSVKMALQTFDGENMIIQGAGDGVNVSVKVGKDGKEISYEDWFTRVD